MRQLPANQKGLENLQHLSQDKARPCFNKLNHHGILRLQAFTEGRGTTSFFSLNALQWRHPFPIWPAP